MASAKQKVQQENVDARHRATLTRAWAKAHRVAFDYEEAVEQGRIAHAELLVVLKALLGIPTEAEVATCVRAQARAIVTFRGFGK